MSDVRVRFAPSPTGFLHIGGLRSALYNYLFARHHGGVFILRIEDTDQARKIEGGVENIIRTLGRAGLQHEEGPFLRADGSIEERGHFGPYVQSSRLEIYRTHAALLLENGLAYRCDCSSERLEEVRKERQARKEPTGYDRHCRGRNDVDPMKPHVLRFAMPGEGESVFHDIIRGEVRFRNELTDDFVLLKSDGFPTYHLASVVDDHLMRVSHVIRGEEWLSSMPKHLELYKAFGWDEPRFAHLPLLLNPDRSKLSKRQGDVAAEDYLEQGYLPEALLNFVALLGWNPDAEREIYSLEELVELFDLSKVNSAGAVFNREKLDWMNGKYLRSMPDEAFAERAAPFLERAGLLRKDGGGWSVVKTGERLSASELGGLLGLEKERVKTLSELPEAVSFLFEAKLDYPPERLVWKASTKPEAAERLRAAQLRLAELDEELWNAKDLEAAMKGLMAENGWGNGDTLWPLRVALSGRERSPGPYEIMAVLGKIKTIARLEDAISRL